MTKRLRLIISSTAWPFSTSAPVGQTCTHLPQLVQDWRLAPRAVEFGHEHRVDAAAEMSQTCAPFDLVADADAARAEDAAIVVQHAARMRDIHRQAREVVGHVDMREPQRLRQGLQFAMAVGDADGADMVALDEQQLERHQPVVGEVVGVGGDRHSALRGCRAGRQQAADAGDLDQAQAAGSRRAQAFQVAERRDAVPIRLRHLEDGLTFRGGAEFTVDSNRDLLRHRYCSLSARDGMSDRLADVAAQTAAGLFPRLFRPQRRYSLLERFGTDRRRQEMRVVTGARAGLRRRLVVLESREDAVEARLADEMAIDVPRRLLAVGHRGDDVRRAGHEVAAGVTRSRGWSSGRSDRPRACRLPWWPGRTPRRIRCPRLRPPPG